MTSLSFYLRRRNGVCWLYSLKNICMRFATKKNRLSENLVLSFCIITHWSNMKCDVEALVECMQPLFWVMKRLVPLWPFWQLSDLSLPSKGRFTHSMPFPCRSHAVSLPCHAAKGLECVFSIWFTQWGRVWFTLAMPWALHGNGMLYVNRP